MNDSSTTTSKIEITDTFTITQAIGELFSLSRQSALITRHIEELAEYKNKVRDSSEKIYDLTFHTTCNLERMAAIAEKLDEMVLVEYSPTVPLPLAPLATNPALDVFLSESFRITALSKSLTAWLMDAKPTDESGSMDMDSGDGLELAHMILTSSQAILKAANEVQK